MGYIPPWKPGSTRQNMMVSRAAARAATAFAQEQYGVFIDGVIGPSHLPDVHRGAASRRACRCTSPAAAAAR